MRGFGNLVMDVVRDKVLRRAQMLIELVQLKCATQPKPDQGRNDDLINKNLR